MRDDKDRSLGRSMKDRPQQLKRNAAVCELAVAIFKARALCFGGPTDFTAEPAHVREQFVTRADELLKTLTPREPAHVAPIAAVRSVDGHDFAAALARNLETNREE